MIPKLMDPNYCLAQAKEVENLIESAPTCRRENLLRVGRPYVHLAELAATVQGKSAASAGAISLRRIDL